MSRCQRLVQLGDCIVDSRILLGHFACDLEACRGACCREGASGAPLLAQEIATLTDELPRLLPFIPEEGSRVLAGGVAYRDADGDWVTSLVEGGPCAFSTLCDGKYRCAIEMAHRDGRTVAQKPISCHLYPIRVGQSGAFTLLRFDSWSICHAAIRRGEALGVRVYQFLREPLVRAFGEPFYEALDATALALAGQHRACQ